MAKYESVAQIVSDAAVELGLVSTDIADPLASADANILLLCRLLTKIGRKLVNEWEWPQLRGTATVLTVNGFATYALYALNPTATVTLTNGKFGRMINQTGWNRTTKLQLGGPVSSQSWEYLKSVGTAATLTVLFRADLLTLDVALADFFPTITVYPTPTSAQTIAFEYVSSDWLIATSGTPGIGADRVTTKDQIPAFDSTLLVAALKLYFRREKGFDTTTTQADYDEALESAKGAFPAPVLSLTPNTYRAPSTPTVPETGYGS